MLFDTFHELDRLGDAFFSDLRSRPLSVPVNLRREDDRYVLEADLPGFDPGSIDVTVEGDWLTIRAERSTNREVNEGSWLLQERGSASVVRRFSLGQDVDPDRIAADYRDGVLTVVLPTRAELRPHKVQVAVGPAAERRAIGAAAPAQSGQGSQQESPARAFAHALTRWIPWGRGHSDTTRGNVPVRVRNTRVA